MGMFLDLTDKQFGRLTVEGVGPKTRSGNYTWRCICACGTPKTIPSDHLVRTQQPVTSCGCYRNERIREVCSPAPDATAFRLLVSTYKKRARLKGFEFALTDDEFRRITSSDCSYCGSPPAMVIENKPKTGRYIYSSVDRKDPRLGYTPGNSTPCCKTCNYMKWTLSESQFLNQVMAIANNARADT